MFSREERKLHHIKMDKPLMQKGIPNRLEGSNGEIRICETPAGVSLAVKYNDRWSIMLPSTERIVQQLNTTDSLSNNISASLERLPDYDSGWTADGTSALTHSLGTEAIKFIQVSYNNTEDDASSTIYNTNDAGGSSPTAVVVTNGVNAITATISNGLNYYRVRLWI